MSHSVQILLDVIILVSAFISGYFFARDMADRADRNDDDVLDKSELHSRCGYNRCPMCRD